MLKPLRRAIRNAIFRVIQTVRSEKSAVLQGMILADRNLDRKKIRALTDVGFGVFSQTDEDGIISWLVDVIEPVERRFVEFGVHDYRESNTRYLISARGWNGLVMDGDPANIAVIRSDEVGYMRSLEAKAAFISRENINELVHESGFGGRVGLLSVDIDGVDYWVLERMTVEADIVVVEYNDFLGDEPVSVPYDASFRRMSACPHGVYWGASLAAFRHLLEQRGYVFVGTNLIGINAFFVRQEHAEKIWSRLETAVVHPGVNRDARDAKGRLVSRPYTDFADAVAELPMVRVDTSDVVPLGSVCRR